MKKYFLLSALLFLAGTAGSSTAGEVGRNVLLEYFSTAYCGWCPDMTAKWNNIAKEYPNLIWVVHHAGFTYDNFTIEESKDYEWFYDQTKFAPGSMLDRTSMAKYGGQMVNEPKNESTYKYYVSACSKVAPGVSLSIDRSFNASNRQLLLTVSGKTLEDIPSTSRLTVYLTEDNVVGAQYMGATSSWDKNYIFSHILRHVLSNEWGDAITPADGTFSRDYSFTIPENEKPENMHIIAFVSNYDPKDKTNCKVLNSEISDVAPDYSGIETVNGDQENRVHVESGKVSVTGRYNSFSVFNIKGERVSTVKKGNIYLIRINTVNGTVVRKFSVR